MKKTFIILTLLSYCLLGFNQNYSYDLVFQRLNFSLDPSVRYIIGQVDYYFKNANSQISIDLTNALTVDSIIYHNLPVNFSHNNDVITVDLQTTPLDLDSIKIFYHGEPSNSGFGSFTTSFHGDNIPIMWTLSEPYGAKDWFPTKNNLGDKIDSLEVIITCDSMYRAASNGILVKDTIIGNKRTMIWKTRYPIASYLVAFAITNYKIYYDTAYIGDTLAIPIMNMVYPEDYENAKEKTPYAARCLEFFSDKFILYPFYKEKYGHAQFGWGGGMEHQTMTFVGGWSEFLLAHELAHQWFGNYITCGSWHDIYLNEAFATYLEGLTAEAGIASYSFNQWLDNARSRVLDNPYGSVYVEDTTDINRIFSYTFSYLKGALFLHLIRWTIGDQAFFSALNSYLQDPTLSYGYALTPELKTHFENACNCDLTKIFNDWLYGTGYPHYDINWTQHYDKLILDIKQNTIGSNVEVFYLNLPILIKTIDGQDTLIIVKNTALEQIYEIPIQGFVGQVIFDPEKWIIATANITSDISYLDVKVYPNPTKDNLTIFLLEPNLVKSIFISDLSGRKLITVDQNFNNHEINLQLTDLKPGVYTIIVIYESFYQQIKFIKL